MRVGGSFLFVLLLSSLVSAQPSSPHYGNLPLSFEENQGQFLGDTLYLSRGPGYLIRLKAAEMELQLSSDQNTDILRASLVGANRSLPAGEQRRLGRVNYFVGSKPANWRTNVPAYAQVRYKSVYDGIDLLYHGHGRNLEYSFIVAPTADPRQIRMKLNNVRRAVILGSGELRLELEHGSVSWKRPYSYQWIDGKQRPVKSRFLLSKNVVSFEVINYDHRRELIIDPELVYSTYIGTLDAPGTVPKIAIDSSGNAYISGATASPDWPLTAGAYDSSYGGNPHDLFVTKLNAAGTDVIFSTFIGGNAFEDVSDIAVDNDGSAYLVGRTGSSDFPHTAGAYSASHSSAFWGFLLKLDPSGSTLSYAARLPSIDVNGVTVDGSGNAFFTGAASVEDLPTTTPGVFRSSHGDLLSCGDSFSGLRAASYVWEMNATGSSPVLMTYLSDCEVGNSIALDKNGNIYVAGRSGDRHFVTPGAFQTTFGGIEDGFVTVLNPSGTAAVYSTYYGGVNNDTATGIAVDANANAVISGYTSSPDLPLANAFQDTLQWNLAGLVAKFDSSGSKLVYGTLVSGAGETVLWDVGVDGVGRAFVGGYSAASNFPTYRAFQGTCGIAGPDSRCDITPVVLAFNADGSIAYSTWIGTKIGIGGGAFGLASDVQGNAYIVGFTAAGYPVTAGAYRTEPPLTGFHNFAFVSKISPKVTSGCTLNMAKPTVTICSPLQGATVKSPAWVNALANYTTNVNAMQVYVDGVLHLDDQGPYITDAFLQLAQGTHRVSVKAWSGTLNYLAASNVTVSGTAAQPPCALPTTRPGVRICSPLAGSVVPAGNLRVIAQARTSGRSLTAFRIYVDGVAVFTTNSQTLDRTISITPGVHRLSVRAWSGSGETMLQRIRVTAQ